MWPFKAIRGVLAQNRSTKHACFLSKRMAFHCGPLHQAEHKTSLLFWRFESAQGEQMLSDASTAQACNTGRCRRCSDFDRNECSAQTRDQSEETFVDAQKRAKRSRQRRSSAQ